jgi:homoserine kinase type II
MALLTQLGEDDVREIAERFSLGDTPRAEPIAAGTINSNFRLETARGPLFLRVNEGKTADDVAYEAALVAHLAARGVATPCPLASADGAPYARVRAGLVTLFPWVDGAHRAREALTPQDLRLVGAALAALHKAGVDFPFRRESRYSFSRIVDRWRGIPRDVPPALRADLDELGEELHWLATRTADREALPGGVIHGDLFPDNVLFTANGGVALLDFEQASDGTFLYDLAVCLVAWCYAEGFRRGLTRALIEGYGGLSADGCELFPVELRAASARFAITRITDVELDPRAAHLRALKDYRRFMDRLRAVRGDVSALLG